MYGVRNKKIIRKELIMLNIIGFLIIITASLIGIKGDYTPNQLFNAGLLILIAYILSLMNRFFRLPQVFGYIIAGILAGYNGLGLVNKSFMEDISFIEGLFFMILISNAVRYITKEQSPGIFSKYFLTGIFASLGTFILTLVFFAPLSISLETRIIIGLFSATFSPLVIFTFTENNVIAKQHIQLSFGGYFFALLLWGILTAFMGSPHTVRIKLAFMPVVITASSIVAGIVWGYIAEKMLYHESNNLKSIYPLAVIFLSYPLVNELGFDFLFLAFGIGVYNGVFSERKKTIIERSNFSSLIIFVLFGMHLSLEDAILLGNTNWILVVFLISFFILSRIISIKLSMHFISRREIQLPSIIYFIPCGPMTLILLHIFMPGFKMPLSGEIDISKMYSILITSMMLIFIIFTALYSVLRPSNNTISASATIDT